MHLNSDPPQRYHQRCHDRRRDKRSFRFPAVQIRTNLIDQKPKFMKGMKQKDDDDDDSSWQSFEMLLWLAGEELEKVRWTMEIGPKYSQ